MKSNKEPTCYHCGKKGHFKTDCFKLKNDDKAKNKDAVKEKKKKKSFSKKGKRAMVATWSNEDDSSSESSEVEEVGLMADHEVTSSPYSSHSLSNSRITEDDEPSYEELVESLSEVCYKLKSVSKEKKILQKSFEIILFEKKRLEKDLSTAFRFCQGKTVYIVPLQTPCCIGYTHFSVYQWLK